MTLQSPSVRRCLRLLGLSLGMVAMFGMIPAIAHAQGKSAGKKFVFGEEEVTGKVQRPQVEYIIARKDIADDANLKLKESFIPKLLDSVKQEPF